MATPGNQDKNQQTHHLFHAETQQALDLWLEAIQSHIDHAQAHQQANDRKDVSFGGSKSRADSLDQNNNQHLTYGYRSQHRQQNDRDYHEGLDQGGQSIIDKVLDRLLLEDPTLSDMNDPSTLIMPAQEHPSSVASVRSLQMCVDDNLGAWSTSSSTFLYSRDKNISNDSTRSAIASSANTSMSLESNKFNSSYGVGTGSFSGRSKQQPQSTEESFFAGGSSYSSSLHSHSAASSYVGISDITASLKQNGPSSIPSSQTQEHPGKTTTYQRHRQGHIGAPGGRSQQPLVLQIPGSAMHPRQPDGESPSTSYYSTDSPASSPKLGIISPTSSAFSSTFLTSPEFYVLEVDNLRSDQDGSSASPSQSSSGGSSVVTATANENDSTLIQDDDDRNFTPPSPIYYGASQDLSPMMINEKEAKAKAAMASSPKKVKKLWSVYGSSALKSHPIAQTSKTYEDQIDHGGSNNSKRYMTTTSEALDASNPLLRGLILVDSTQSLKNGSGRSSGSSNSKSGSDGKGSRFSKSMTSLPKKHDDLSSSRDLFSAPAAQSYEHRHLPLPPRTRTGSVSIIDEKLPKPQHQHLRHQPHRQYSSDSIKPQPSIGNILSSVISIPILQIQQQQQSSSASSTTRGSVHTAPIKVASGSWTPKTGADGRPRYQSAQMRCIDPDLVLTPGHRSHSLISPLSSTAAPSSSAGSSRQETTHSNGTEQVHGKNPFVVDVARQIVPTDELVQAIAQETAAEELLKQRRERQELEVVKMSEESKVENSNIESLPTHQIVQEGLAATTTHSDHDDQVQGQDTGAPTIPLRSPYRAAVNATQR
ncbi:hypothetical protein BGZ83_010538 [Gryganskiella cystojenkinii]|nr:hypothetical protein BGZ83_010538 [Gryganskiella cystojenkinii]